MFRLVLYGGYARGWRTRASPDEIEQRQAIHILMGKGWRKDNPAFRQIFTSLFVPGATQEEMTWLNDLQRMTTSPENAIRLSTTLSDIVVLDLLPRVQVEGTGSAVASDKIAGGHATATTKDTAAAGSGSNSAFSEGIAVFHFTEKGLMAEADISGTKYWKDGKLNNN